ncbi:MAG TPA: hypothetical protein ENI15_19150 [Spirochaetes bacterium]|nr:hypothetical protein [Spirochaetota bacterium]
MKILKNQTLYKCSYCGRRKLTKRGCLQHEDRYCSNELSPHQMGIKKWQSECPHKNTETVYSYIPGEAVQQPDHDVCLDCNARV